MSAHKNCVDVDSLIRMHFDEKVSILQCARHFGVTRGVCVWYLKKRGLTPRGRSEANIIRMEREGVEGRARLTEAAHAAVRGCKQTREQQERRAVGVEVASNLSPLEKVFEAALTRKKIPFVAQKAVGKFNIDFAVSNLAVEVDPGHWHDTPKKSSFDRTKDSALVAAGYRVIRITGWRIRLSNPEFARIAEDFVALVKSLRFDPAPLGKHSMIRCRAKRTTYRSKTYEFTFEPVSVDLEDAARPPARAPEDEVTDSDCIN